MLNVNGNSNDRPTRPPRPGITPSTSPIITPKEEKTQSLHTSHVLERQYGATQHINFHFALPAGPFFQPFEVLTYACVWTKWYQTALYCQAIGHEIIISLVALLCGY